MYGGQKQCLSEYPSKLPLYSRCDKISINKKEFYFFSFDKGGILGKMYTVESLKLIGLFTNQHK